MTGGVFCTATLDNRPGADVHMLVTLRWSSTPGGASSRQAHMGVNVQG